MRPYLFQVGAIRSSVDADDEVEAVRKIVLDHVSLPKARVKVWKPFCSPATYQVEEDDTGTGYYFWVKSAEKHHVGFDEPGEE